MAQKTDFSTQNVDTFEYAMAEFQRNQAHRKRPDLSAQIQEIFDRQKQVEQKALEAMVDRVCQEKPSEETSKDIFAEFFVPNE